jgi:hypothetical protein
LTSRQEKQIGDRFERIVDLMRDRIGQLSGCGQLFCGAQRVLDELAIGDVGEDSPPGRAGQIIRTRNGAAGVCSTAATRRRGRV